MATLSLFTANTINTIGMSSHVTDTTPFFVASVSIGNSSMFVGTSALVAASTTPSTFGVNAMSSVTGTTATFVDSDDGVVLVSGTVPTGINPFTAGSGFFVTTGTLTVTTNTIAGTIAQDFHIHGNVFFGTSLHDVLSVQPGDIAFGGDGDDTISVSGQTGLGASHDRAFVFGGPGDDTIVDLSTRDAPVPVTAVGGSGDDTFVVAGVAPSGTAFTGGDGHDLFHFSTLPLHGADATITDFGSHDAIVIDMSPTFPPSIAFTDSRTSMAVDAIAAGGTVHLTLVGSFDRNQFHVADDGHNHAVITYGNSDFVLS